MRGEAGRLRLAIPQPLIAKDAGVQGAEKSELHSTSVKFPLANTATAISIGAATNLALQAGTGAATYIEGRLAEQVAARADYELVNQLLAASAAVAPDVAAAIGTAIATGWSQVVLLVHPGYGARNATDLAAIASLGLGTVVADPYVTVTETLTALAVAVDGLSLAVNDLAVLTGPDEPALVGRQHGVRTALRLEIGLGAVAGVAAP